jgi:hypothetical protein
MPGEMLSLNLEVYEPYIDPKSHPVLVTVRLYLAVDISLILTIKPANKRRLKCLLNDYRC